MYGRNICFLSLRYFSFSLLFLLFFFLNATSASLTPAWLCVYLVLSIHAQKLCPTCTWSTSTVNTVQLSARTSPRSRSPPTPTLLHVNSHSTCHQGLWQTLCKVVQNCFTSPLLPYSLSAISFKVSRGRAENLKINSVIRSACCLCRGVLWSPFF